ncbi:MAG: riboflavin biosynthesis protein RibF [Bacillota bacterium]|nr:riboflavin biosynthesis protein RibF [Bacillota bacterium]
MGERADFLEAVDSGITPRPSAVALGYFDGVHRGHQSLIRRLVAAAAARGLETVVFSFDRLPQKEAFDGPERSYSGLIQPLEERVLRLRDFGVDHVCLQTYNDRFRRLEARDFLDLILGRLLAARVLVVGPDFRFGYERRGDVETLRDWCGRNNCELIVCPDVRLDGEPVSSQRIRQALIAGDAELARELIGSPMSIRGRVVRGQALGRTVGMPTANVTMPESQLCPRYGVYHSITRVGAAAYASVTNIGIRPTVNHTSFVPLLETSLLDVEIDLYGEDISVELLSWLRPEIEFPSFLTMTARIHEDINTARDWSMSHETPLCLLREPGLTHIHLPSRRFSVAKLELDFRLPPDLISPASLSLLARILSSTSARYPTSAAFALATDDLYGATVGGQLLREGDVLDLCFYADAVRRGVDGSRPFHDLTELVHGMIHEPALDGDGLLSAAIFRTEQRNLMAELGARRQERSRYALERCLSVALPGVRGRLAAGPPPNEVAALTRAQVTADWQTLLERAELTLYTAGELGADLLNWIHARLLALPTANRVRLVPGRLPSQRLPELRRRETVETLPGGQTRILLGYRPQGREWFPEDGALLQLLDNLLGDSAHSLLFHSFREEHAWSYEVDSFLLQADQLLLLRATVPPSAEREARAEMERTVARLAAEPDSDLLERFEMSRLAVIDDLMASRDDIGALLDDARRMESSRLRRSIAERIRETERLRFADLQVLARGLEACCVYILRAGEDET